MAVFGGEFLPVVIEVAHRLDAAKAKLAALPRPGVESATGLPWDHTSEDRQHRIDEAEAEVHRLEGLMSAAERHTLHHVVDLLECIEQTQENYRILREALTYARALASIEDRVAA